MLDSLRRLSPSLTMRLLSLFGRVLPKALRTAPPMQKGRDVMTGLPGSLPLRLGDRAAAKNNEAPPV